MVIDWKTVDINEVTKIVIGAAMRVHTELGPGLLESAYGFCLCHELELEGVPFEQQKPLPVVYKGKSLDCGYRLDILVAGRLIVELKAVKEIMPIHEAQAITYMKLSGCNLALIINFNVRRLKNCGIKRLVYDVLRTS